MKEDAKSILRTIISQFEDLCRYPKGYLCDMLNNNVNTAFQMGLIRFNFHEDKSLETIINLKNTRESHNIKIEQAYSFESANFYFHVALETFSNQNRVKIKILNTDLISEIRKTLIEDKEYILLDSKITEILPISKTIEQLEQDLKQKINIQKSVNSIEGHLDELLDLQKDTIKNRLFQKSEIDFANCNIKEKNNNEKNIKNNIECIRFESTEMSKKA